MALKDLVVKKGAPRQVPEYGWAIKTASGLLIISSIAPTRRQTIADHKKALGKWTWEQVRREGACCVRVAITEL